MVPDPYYILVFTMHKIDPHYSRLGQLPRQILGAAILLIGVWFATPATAEKEKTEGSISLSVATFERMPQYPPPPPLPKVIVVTAGTGHELAVITIKVEGSTAFEDYKMCVGTAMVDAEGIRHTAVLSKPFKAGYQPEVWDKQVLVFPIKKNVKLKTLSVADMTFDLSKVEETK